MKQLPSSLSLAIRQGMAGIHRAFKAKLASYLGAVQTRTWPQATRINTNPQSVGSQYQRVQMMFDGESIVKNSDFGANYVQKRRMYCTSGMNYSPDTGDHVLDEELKAYLDEKWARMGINQSMQEAVSIALDVEQPMRGDSALVWVRDLTQMRLMVVEADRIGEIYQYFTNSEVIEGLDYYAGIFSYPTRDPNYPGQYAAFRIYERIDQWYGNPQTYPASDVMFAKDQLMAGMRGVSKFAQALSIVGNREVILYATMQTMQQQSKIAAIASNNAGEPDELTYDTQRNQNGTVNYVERYSDGPVVRYQYNGDSYQVLRAEHPTESFQLAMDKLDDKAALAVGFPYAFLFSSRDIGGAPARFDFSIASKEIERLRNNVYRPKLNIISYVSIMDAIERKHFRPYRNITRGMWNFGTLPSADAYRDSKADLAEIWAGVQTRNDVVTAASGRPYAVVLRQTAQEAVAIAKATQDANKELTKDGYEPTVVKEDIAQISANPQTPQANEKPTEPAKSLAAA